MGFKSVYRCLQEVFPQIDARILKAVAIEHSKDVDAAVNDILIDVLPYLGQSTVSTNSPRGGSSTVELEENATLLRSHPVVEVADVGSSASSIEQGSIVCENNEDNACTSGTWLADITHMDDVDDAGPSLKQKSTAGENADGSHWLHAVVTYLDAIEDVMPSSKPISPARENAENSDCRNGACQTDRTHLDEAVNESKVSSSNIANDSDNDLNMDTMSEELILLGKTRETINELELNQNACVISNALKQKGTDDQVCMDTETEVPTSCNKIISKVSSEQSPPYCVSTDVFNGSLNDPQHLGLVNDFDLVRSCKVDACVDDSLLEPENFVSELAPLSVQVHTADSTDPSLTNQEESQESGFLGLTSSEMGSNEDDITRNNLVSRSNEICRIDILDEIIEDAKNNKKTLFSAMESVINMMKEVEIQERAAEHAKEEAALGGLDILIKVEELKQMLAHAKEANSMHAGEVYGEKAILATEVRELQSRLLCLSDERDKSLATLDEMRKTLEARLAAAEVLRKASEQEKLEKEESARNFLAEQEAIMENVVEESKLIAQAAEENSKLREFLVDRGRILDTLQGEISVICQDVSLLKEKFDKRLPLSISVSSSQTSCKLASSGSAVSSSQTSSKLSSSGLSLKSVASILASEVDESSKKSKNRSPGSSIGNITPKSRAEEDGVKPYQNELSEDGWDILKDDELDAGTWVVKTTEDKF